MGIKKTCLPAGREKIFIFDTTLRDGEQAPGASLTSIQKLEIAYQLENLGVDVIEAGFPVASPDDFKAVSNISSKIKKSSVCGLARCTKKDIETAAKSLKKAKKPRIHIFLATSGIHLKYKFKKAEEEILALTKKYTKLARNYCPDIEFSPEDATRSSKDFLYQIIEAAISCGAKTINIPDTVGYSYPQEITSLISDIKNNVSNINKAIISIHCHDDLGMATANSLAALSAGARQAHCTINGIGERAGNASLEEVVMAIKTRKDVFSDFKLDINSKEITRISRLVSNLTGFTIAPNKSIVGRNAFAHEAGIHQDAVLKKRSTYEIMNPKDVGLGKSQLVLGKHSGRHALAKRLKKLGFVFEKKKNDLLFKKFKSLADKKKEVFDEDLIALAEEETKPRIQAYKLVSVAINTGKNLPQASVKIRYKRKILKEKAFGDGPVDSCYKAIDKITGVKAKLLNYKLDAVTRGKDAQGRAKVELKIKGKLIVGRGSSTDILEASVKAYLDAINRAV
ncbi:MAG: 2-isopropylmalate synthase [Candidatus Omnitrophica bacterium]|nr:2-isopropylmalate synthase [Candidatus Omnitrophota bacterium]MCF7895093.1 2-isopropylmalate synthase [Candidatus Omnitrophota bacterium]